LELLRDPKSFYRKGNASVKHGLTKVIFAKLCRDMQEVAVVNDHDLGEGVGDLIEAEGRRRTFYRSSETLSGWEDSWNDSRSFGTEGPTVNDLTGADLLAWALMGQGRIRHLWWS